MTEEIAEHSGEMKWNDEAVHNKPEVGAIGAFRDFMENAEWVVDGERITIDPSHFGPFTSGYILGQHHREVQLVNGIIQEPTEPAPPDALALAALVNVSAYMDRIDSNVVQKKVTMMAVNNVIAFLKPHLRQVEGNAIKINLPKKPWWRFGR